MALAAGALCAAVFGAGDDAAPSDSGAPCDAGVNGAATELGDGIDAQEAVPLESVEACVGSEPVSPQLSSLVADFVNILDCMLRNSSISIILHTSHDKIGPLLKQHNPAELCSWNPHARTTE